MTYLPRRSALYMPGINSRALEKARTLAADVLIFDLEDAVAPAEKPAALANIRSALTVGGYGDREVIVRVNSLDSAWGREEVAQLAGLPLQGLCIPKVESPATLVAFEALMKQAGYPKHVALWAMIETPAGVSRLREIASTGGRLQVLVAGTNDLSAQLRIPIGSDRRGLLTSLSLMILAARANDLDVLDGAYGDFHDADGLIASCHEGRALGFDGKTLIHPAQLEHANTIFAPDDQALDAARRIVTAWDTADAASGVIVVDGSMIEELHVAAARRLLDISSAIQARASVEK